MICRKLSFGVDPVLRSSLASTSACPRVSRTNNTDNTNILLLIDEKYGVLGPYTRNSGVYRCVASKIAALEGKALLPVVRTVADLRAAIAAARRGGKTIGLVPTMGALHEGHLSLVRAAKQRCSHVVATLFVNPKQFAPHEDFERYPRDEAGDANMLASAGCDLLYAPARSVMYPDGFATSVLVSSVSTMLEGQMRPHFFGGVATVVTKLLLQALPDSAFFGEKDYQQLLVIKQLTRDLDIPVEIIGCATVREHDGLAMSSRNRFLSEIERRLAPRLYQALSETAHAIASGRCAAEPLQAAHAALSEVLMSDSDKPSELAFA